MLHGFGRSKLFLESAFGAIYRDVSGKEYIDCVAGNNGDALVGHNHPKLVQAITNQAESLIAAPISAIIPKRIELAEKLVKVMPKGLGKVFFTNGGSEAVETALKGAMRITGKKEVISLYHAYHGSTIGCSSLGHPWYKEGYPIVPGFR